MKMRGERGEARKHPDFSPQRIMKNLKPIDWSQVRDRAIAAILGGLCSASTAYILFRLFE